MSRARILKTRNLCAVLLLALAACGCRLSMPEHKLKASTQSQKDVVANYNQVRLRLRAMVGPACGEIEQTADQIITGTTNVAVQRAALLWKSEGVPALRAALFQPNPYTACFDTWVLCYQMADYFETGPGKPMLGEASPIAVAACRRLEEEMNRVAASMTLSGDVTEGRAFAKKWAEDHPIRHSITSRETTLSRSLERGDADSVSAGEAVAEITTTVDDLNRRLEIYSDQLFRQARWEAQLFKSELLTNLPVTQVMPLAERAMKSAEQTVATVDRLATALERAVVTVENAPKLVAGEREVAIKAVQDELTRTIKLVQEERVAALKELHENMIVERKALTRDLDLIGLKTVDQAFWRGTQLLAVGLVLLAISLAVMGTIHKRSLTKNP
jgi:hypothetical protein